MRFTRRDSIVDAIQFDGTIKSAGEIARWANKGLSLDEDRWVDYVTADGDEGNAHDMMVHSIGGILGVEKDDWVVKLVSGQVLAVNEALFLAIYQAIN